MPLNVAVIHPSLNFRGGAERTSISIIEALKDNGHKVSLITIDKTDWVRIEEFFGLRALPDREYCMDEKLDLSKIKMTIYNSGILLLKLLKFIHSSKFDVLISTYGDLDLLNRMVDVVYVGGMPFSSAKSHKDLMPEILKHTHVQMAYQIADTLIKAVKRDRKPTILANSTFTKEKVMKLYKGRYRIDILHPPCSVREDPYTNNKERLVLTMSRLTSGKGLDMVPSIAKKSGSWRYIIAGSTTKASAQIIKTIMHRAKECGIHDQLEIVKDPPRQILSEILSKTKVYLHTMKSESFGISIVEAMAAGCVPVVHRSGGAWYDVLKGIQGYYGYGYDEYHEAATYINMLENESLYRMLSSRAMQRAREFDVGIFKERFTRKFNEVVRSKGLDDG